MDSVAVLTLGLGPRLGFALPGAPGLGWLSVLRKSPISEEAGNSAPAEPKEHAVADLIRA